jgi:hypothetical protein
MTACLHCHHRIAQDGYGAWLDRTGTPECTSSFGDHVPCEATPPSDDPEGAGHIEVHVVTATHVVFMVVVERIDNHLHVTTEGPMPADIKVSFLRELADSIEAGIAGTN